VKGLARRLIDGLLARRGRAASLLGFALAVLLLVVRPGPIQGLGLDWFDAMNRIWPRESTSEPVIIVAIDEASVAEIGVWPWPRAVTASLFRRIADAGPAAVGVDILFAEAEGAAPAAIAERPGAPPEAQAWLRSLPSGDDVLAEVIATGPFVLGVGDLGLAATAPPTDLPPAIVVEGPDPADAVHRWRAPFRPLRSQPIFTEVASGEGVIATGAAFDGVARQTGQVYDLGGGFLAPGLAIEMLRVASGANRIVAATDAGGVSRLILKRGDRPVLVAPTAADGSLRPWFGPRRLEREIPAIDLLREDSEQERLTGQLVLVGYTAAGGLDERLSPLGVLAPGVDVHRQTLEGIFDDTLLTRPRWAPEAEIGLAVLLAAFAAFAPGRFGVAGGVAAGFGAALAPLLLALAAYAAARLVFDAAVVSTAGVVAGLPAFFAQVAIADRERRQAEAARARIDGEMAAAKRMQMGILPDAAAAFPGETRFSIAATTEPARTVGGDLFDFFLLDDRRLFFLVGDVAGKGPEASLFMAISKQLTKSAALRSGGDVGQVLSEANAEIARDNPAMMFVTVFAGVLDVETGALDYCCAGHEPPWRVPVRGEAERLGGAGGPPLCLLDAFDYPTDRIRLDPGDLVVVVTDGVTEAANQEGELFGVPRTDAAVRRLVGATSAPAALDLLIAPAHAFADGAEPADDLTALVVVWSGGTAAADSA